MRPTPVYYRLRQSVIEAERKFHFDKSLLERFRANNGNPPFFRLEYLGKKTFEDIYFDQNELLCSNGIWVRKRNGNWQAKLRQKGGGGEGGEGGFTNAQYEELEGKDRILDMIRGRRLNVNNDNNADPNCERLGLQLFARYTTYREAWKLDEKFEVVLDTTDFGHSVGEVELVETIEVEDDDEQAATARKRAVASDMDGKIEAFMRQYSWAFGKKKKPVGKLTAYFSAIRAGTLTLDRY
ncbi:hypothetical protein AJ80_09221 [Polytolypa hystricis UAMH7299]|uniref:Thiamine-triphosphatase n=1 Tax=Polytolypa hystricis (strain UAMH7299) TaxID=1447883 RepID=A0A2B7WUN7_POLH7|nr:hypothetical protein AJ80_09221 [Polytolypa hystricis UAMH7299]